MKSLSIATALSLALGLGGAALGDDHHHDHGATHTHHGDSKSGGPTGSFKESHGSAGLEKKTNHEVVHPEPKDHPTNHGVDKTQSGADKIVYHETHQPVNKDKVRTTGTDKIKFGKDGTRIADFTPRVGKGGFKDDLIRDHNSKFKYFKDTVSDRSYFKEHSTKFKFKSGEGYKEAYCYKGLHHPHWSYCCWNTHYHCWLYWDPFCSCYYYWHAPCETFFPVVCAPEEIPVVIDETTVVEEEAIPAPPDGDQDS